MNIILDKTAFNEWQNRIKNIHQEFTYKYWIIYENCDEFVTGINADHDGNFMCLYFKVHKICSYCKHIYYHYFNYRYRNTRFGIGSLNNKCKTCIGIDLPKNYWLLIL